MGDTTDYGIKLERGDGAMPETFSVIAGITNITPPGLLNPAIENTDHDTGAYRDYISSGLRELEEFTITINYDPTSLQYNATTGLLADVAGGLTHNWKIVYPNPAMTTWSFAALVTHFAPGAADATSPKVLAADVTFRPRGVPTLA